MSDTPTPSAPATPVAATLKELKTALPKSSAEFREKCLEDGVTTQQAMARFIEQQDAALEQAKQSSKKIGTDPVGGGSGKPAKAEEGVVDFKSLVNAKVQAGTPRAQAWAEAARENPEAHEAYVLQHNAKHGRRHAEMPGAYSR